MWTKLRGFIDARTWSTLEGKLDMPKSSFPAKPFWKPNYPSWNLVAKTALGPTLATQGIVEVGIPGYHNLSLYTEPLGEVDKATAPFQRLLTNSQLSN